MSAENNSEAAPAEDSKPSVSPTRQALVQASKPLRRRRASLQCDANPGDQAPWMPAGRHTAKTRWQAEMARAQTEANPGRRRARRKSLPDVLAAKSPPTSPPLEMGNMDFSNLEALKAARDKYQVRPAIGP